MSLSMQQKTVACKPDQNKYSEEGIYMTLYSGTSDNRLPLLWKPPQCGWKATVPNYSLKCTVHGDLCTLSRSLPIPNYGHWSHIRPNGQNQYKFPPESGWSCERIEKFLLFLKIFAICIHSSKASLHSRSTHACLMCHVATGKCLHITRCTLCIKTPPYCGHFSMVPWCS